MIEIWKWALEQLKFSSRMKRYLVLILAVFSLYSSSAYSYSVRCNKDQTQCQIKTKRLTVGDFVGIFDEYKYLQAVGKITKIVGKKRILKITKKFTLITKDSVAKRISDEEAARPRSYFKIYRKDFADITYECN